MLLTFTGISNLLKAHLVHNDGFVFQLHCRVTVLYLLGASILLTSREYFGDPIVCFQNKKDSKKVHSMTESFCWVHGTHILPQAWNASVGDEVAHPGIGEAKLYGDEKEYHYYYQWVSLVLVLQAVFFYLPRYFWKNWERGLMKSYTLNLRDPLLNIDKRKENYQLLSEALHSSWGQFQGYIRKYVFCEVLLFVNVVCQMSFLNKFLGGIFTDFGVRVLQWTQWEQEYRTDPLVRAFPRMTKCIFRYGGPSGGSNTVDALCILSLNILNEKIFVFLWFWMVILCCFSAGLLIYRALLCARPGLRYRVLALKAPLANKQALERLVTSSSLGDWFVLYQLSKNIDPLHYRAVISYLTTAIEKNGRIAKRLESKLEHESHM